MRIICNKPLVIFGDFGGFWSLKHVRKKGPLISSDLDGERGTGSKLYYINTISTNRNRQKSDTDRFIPDSYQIHTNTSSYNMFQIQTDSDTFMLHS